MQTILVKYGIGSCDNVAAPVTVDSCVYMDAISTKFGDSDRRIGLLCQKVLMQAYDLFSRGYKVMTYPTLTISCFRFDTEKDTTLLFRRQLTWKNLKYLEEMFQSDTLERALTGKPFKHNGTEYVLVAS